MDADPAARPAGGCVCDPLVVDRLRTGLAFARPQRTEMHSIPLDQSEVRVDLRMGAGELRIRGGSYKLMEAEFTYHRLRMRPEVRYDSGHLTVEEPSGFGASEGRYVGI